MLLYITEGKPNKINKTKNRKGVNLKWESLLREPEICLMTILSMR